MCVKRVSWSLDAAVVNVCGLVLRTPDQDAYLAPVHEDEALALVGDICAKATAYDTVPSRQVHLVKLCLDDLSDVVEDAALLKGKGDAIDSVLLHWLIHVSILDHCILCFLLIDLTMRLYNLIVRLALPLLSLISAGVCYNLSYRCHAFSFLFY